MPARPFALGPGTLAAACLAAASFVAPASAQERATDDPGSFPTPAVANDDWTLDFQPGTPTAVAIDDAFGNTRWYWYLPYTVTNHSGADQRFIPEVAVLTDTGTIIEAGKNVPARAFTQISAELSNPLLETPQSVVGVIRQGVDFEKDSVFIWPVPTDDVDQFTVFVAGLSGETAVLTKPSTGEPLMEPALDIETGQPMMDEQGNPVMRPVIARRTTALTYATPGTPDSPQKRPVTLLDSAQVMR
ncbi:MAG: hypothetical protein AAGF84_07220 [Planctomycetota bacterium]